MSLFEGNKKESTMNDPFRGFKQMLMGSGSFCDPYQPDDSDEDQPADETPSSSTEFSSKPMHICAQAAGEDIDTMDKKGNATSPEAGVARRQIFSAEKIQNSNSGNSAQGNSAQGNSAQQEDNTTKFPIRDSMPRLGESIVDLEDVLGAIIVDLEDSDKPAHSEASTEDSIVSERQPVVVDVVDRNAAVLRALGGKRTGAIFETKTPLDTVSTETLAAVSSDPSMEDGDGLETPNLAGMLENAMLTVPEDSKLAVTDETINVSEKDKTQTKKDIDSPETALLEGVTHLEKEESVRNPKRAPEAMEPVDNGVDFQDKALKFYVESTPQPSSARSMFKALFIWSCFFFVTLFFQPGAGYNIVWLVSKVNGLKERAQLEASECHSLIAGQQGTSCSLEYAKVSLETQQSQCSAYFSGNTGTSCVVETGKVALVKTKDNLASSFHQIKQEAVAEQQRCKAFFNGRQSSGCSLESPYDLMVQGKDWTIARAANIKARAQQEVEACNAFLTGGSNTGCSVEKMQKYSIDQGRKWQNWAVAAGKKVQSRAILEYEQCQLYLTGSSGTQCSMEHMQQEVKRSAEWVQAQLGGEAKRNEYKMKRRAETFFDEREPVPERKQKELKLKRRAETFFDEREPVPESKQKEYKLKRRAETFFEEREPVPEYKIKLQKPKEVSKPSEEVKVPQRKETKDIPLDETAKTEVVEGEEEEVEVVVVVAEKQVDPEPESETTKNQVLETTDEEENSPTTPQAATTDTEAAIEATIEEVATESEENDTTSTESEEKDTTDPVAEDSLEEEEEPKEEPHSSPEVYKESTTEKDDSEVSESEAPDIVLEETTAGETVSAEEPQMVASSESEEAELTPNEPAAEGNTPDEQHEQETPKPEESPKIEDTLKDADVTMRFVRVEYDERGQPYLVKTDKTFKSGA